MDERIEFEHELFGDCLELNTETITQERNFHKKICKLLSRVLNALKPFGGINMFKEYIFFNEIESKWINMFTHEEKDKKFIILFINLTSCSKFRCGWILKIFQDIKLHCSDVVCMFLKIMTNP